MWYMRIVNTYIIYTMMVHNGILIKPNMYYHLIILYNLCASQIMDISIYFL